MKEEVAAMNRYESIWTDLASLAVAGASLAFLAFMLNATVK